MSNAIYLIDKPQGLTSFGAVARVRRATGEKCGHSGTLDPLATGLLPVMAGKATKLCALLTGGEKQYVGTLKLGLRTDTGDCTGNLLETRPFSVTEQALCALLPRFTGAVTQRPPVYSAIKVAGRPLYRYAREGKAIEAPARTVEIKAIRLLSFNEEAGEAVLRVDCGKGTYIRTLFEDLAAAAGTVGTMQALRRTRVGRFSLDQACTLEALERAPARCAIPMEAALDFLPAYTPPDFFAGLLENGCAVAAHKLPQAPDTLCRVYRGDRLLGLGDRIEQNGEAFLKVVTHL